MKTVSFCLLFLMLTGCSTLQGLGDPAAPEVSVALLKDIDQGIAVAESAGGLEVFIACAQKKRAIIEPLNDGDNSLPGPVTTAALALALRNLARQCVVGL